MTIVICLFIGEKDNVDEGEEENEEMSANKVTNNNETKLTIRGKNKNNSFYCVTSDV